MWPFWFCPMGTADLPEPGRERDRHFPPPGIAHGLRVRLNIGIREKRDRL